MIDREKAHALRTLTLDAYCKYLNNIEKQMIPFGPRSSLLAGWTLAADARNRVKVLRRCVAEPIVALVPGGAILGFDNQAHIDLDLSHTVLSPGDARQFAATLRKIADMIDPFSGEPSE